jgi:hypothetical protein
MGLARSLNQIKSDSVDTFARVTTEEIKYISSRLEISMRIYNKLYILLAFLDPGCLAVKTNFFFLLLQVVISSQK